MASEMIDSKMIDSELIDNEASKDLEAARGVYRRLAERLRLAVRGRDAILDLVIVALLADGHVLLEDYPGSGKTTLAKALGASIVDDQPDDQISAFRRIQFTPDLLPSDITGASIFDPQASAFFFRPGPLFAHILLADEINRTSPKVQSALLEAMAEKQVTVDNRTYPLDELFFVIATQNPLDVAGTFPLPSPQLDRFLFKIRMTHIDRAAELEVLASYEARRGHTPPGGELPQVQRREILEARALIEEKIFVAPAIRECLVDIAEETRSNERVLLGASTRSLVLALPALKARAMIRGRDFVSSEDIEALAIPLFAHRIELLPGDDDAPGLIRSVLKKPLERLARATMRR